ncbi:sodium:proton antiporter (plasmid) [Halostagnicola larsenii XH-48]|uniref:Sodium:proton antiporter n=1 Tax=Halostagnicola larsenii XH-48 TaxID=797299 RepID=W0JZM8_9EURY|nr:MnhB domain-containing protein [Halostagnicola larsenii]AHG02398.1 sodium:proton antiporter [Halostagnicola larsenii XH-48]
MTTIVMRTTARVVVPIILVVAIELLIQGHNLPGGGFIAGVLTVVAFALVYVAYGLDYLEIGILERDIDPYTGIFEHRTVVAYRQLFTFGLVLAIASGIAGLLFGEPFLSQTFVYVELPLFGDVELASALVFDVGVYCVVVGGLLTILSVVGDE